MVTLRMKMTPKNAAVLIQIDCLKVNRKKKEVNRRVSVLQTIV